ncbi:MAG TPA: cellulase family glycosylhydrolase [Pyrinomonadaceae bacterium]|nr:cellulase family glycosylhydrolase [Pyrinomonadaceae bacterium]
MLKRTQRSILLLLTLAIVTHLSTVASGAAFFDSPARGLSQEKPLNLAARFARLRRGVNLSHWFSQAPNYTKERLETHTTAQDIALIKSMGFDHVRFPIEPAPLLSETPDPSILNSTYLQYVDRALDMILAAGLAVVIDIHPSDEFKLRLNRDERGVEAFAQFWRAFATHLSKRDPEFVFLEVINEPMVEDGYRWYGIQGKLIAAIRSAAPNHTIIASGHRWSGLSEMLFLEPYSDANIIYNFHFYEPFAFTHQGATWAGPNLPFYKNVPYPSSPEAVKVLLDAIQDEPARYNLLRYGEDNWNAARIDRELGFAAAWATKRHVYITCNEFGAFRKFSRAADRVAWVHDMRVGLEKHGIGWTMWDYAGGFAAVNKTNGQAQKDPELSKALGLK